MTTDTKQPITPKAPCECHRTWEEHLEFCESYLWDEPHLSLSEVIRTRRDAEIIFDLFVAAHVRERWSGFRRNLLDPEPGDFFTDELWMVKTEVEEQAPGTGRNRALLYLRALDNSPYFRDILARERAWNESPEGKKVFSRALDGVFGAEPPTDGAA